MTLADLADLPNRDELVNWIHTETLRGGSTDGLLADLILELREVRADKDMMSATIHQLVKTVERMEQTWAENSRRDPAAYVPSAADLVAPLHRGPEVIENHRLNDPAELRLETGNEEVALDYQDMEDQAHAPLPSGVQYANDPERGRAHCGICNRFHVEGICPERR